MAYNILIADDEAEILDKEELDCALLDVMMPELNGFQLLKKIREKKDIPILMITARVAASDKILGLDLGADDYITKPFDPMEVVARVNANIRRFKKLFPTQKELEADFLLSFENVQLDTKRCCFLLDGKDVEITGTDFKILSLFMSSPGRVFTKTQISEAGWGKNFYVEDNSIMVALSKLRSKLGSRVTIKNIRGLGWRLEKNH